MSVDMTTQSIAVGDDWVKVGNDYVGNQPSGAISGGNAALGWSAPDGVAQGSSVSLLTDGTNPFGTGPTNVKYDNYENGTAGADVSLANSEYDTVSAFYPAKFRADSRSGNLAITGRTDDGATSSINTIDLTSTREVFLSYATKIPTGSFFPGNSTDNIPSDFYSTDSSWKIAWLQDDADIGKVNDICVPSHNGNGSWLVGGNGLDNKLTGLNGPSPTWFGFNNWTRICGFLKAGATPQTDLGKVYFQALTSGVAMYEQEADVVVFSGGRAEPPYHWTQLNITGYSRSDSGVPDKVIQMLYDDLYVAWGANAAARVELGDNATYTSCTDLHIQHVTPANWATGQLDFNIDYGPFAPSTDLWYHITLEDNSTRYTLRAN